MKTIIRTARERRPGLLGYAEAMRKLYFSRHRGKTTTRDNARSIFKTWEKTSIIRWKRFKLYQHYLQQSHREIALFPRPTGEKYYVLSTGGIPIELVIWFRATLDSSDAYVPPKRITVGEWMDEWWRIYCLPSKKISTCTGYESTIIWHIKPHLGKVSLQELKPMQVQAMINQLVKEGKAPSTIRKAQALLHCALEQAIVNGMLIHNPAERTILPRMERKEIQFLTLEEQRRFIAALTDNTPGRALYFILGTGLRAAELTGLRWSDIKDNHFTVAQTIRRNRDFSDNAECKTFLETSTPKTRAGRRMIPLPPKMKELLAAQRREQLEMRLAAGPEWTNNDLVFCTEFGTPFEGRNMTRSLHQTLRRAGLPLRGVHALRHTFATRAMESGMDLRTLSEILGHSQVALTLQLYAHSTMETKRDVMEKMDVFL